MDAARFHSIYASHTCILSALQDDKRTAGPREPKSSTGRSRVDSARPCLSSVSSHLSFVCVATGSSNSREIYWGLGGESSWSAGSEVTGRHLAGASDNSIRTKRRTSVSTWRFARACFVSSLPYLAQHPVAPTFPPISTLRPCAHIRPTAATTLPRHDGRNSSKNSPRGALVAWLIHDRNVQLSAMMTPDGSLQLSRATKHAEQLSHLRYSSNCSLAAAMNSSDVKGVNLEDVDTANNDMGEAEMSAKFESASMDPMPSSSQSQQLLGWRLFAVEAVLCLGLLLSVMESSIVATALVTIGLAIVFARLSDVIGRKWAVLMAWLLFTIFSLGEQGESHVGKDGNATDQVPPACGFSSSLDQLIAFRTLQGMVVVPEVSPARLFAIMSGCIGAVFSVSGVLGPVLGGVITEQSTWRWIFWLNSPFGLTAMIVLLVSWPGDGKNMKRRRVKLSDVDWLGALLLLAASVLLVFGLQQAGSTAFAWNSAGSIVVFVLSGLCWIAFVIWIVYLHRRCQAGKSNREGIFPLSVVVRGKMAVVIITTFLTGFSFILVLIYLPERFQVVQLKSPVRAGISMLPMLCCTAIGSALGGLASSKKNLTFWTLTIGNAFVLLGCGLFTTVQISFEIPAHEYAYEVFFGLGVGMTFSTATVMCVLEARHQDLAVAQGLVNQARVLGGAIGLSIATIIFNSLATSQLAGVLTPDELSQLLKSPQTAYQFPLDKQIAVREVFGHSFNKQLRVCMYIAAVSFVVSLLGFSRHPVDTLKRKAEHDAWMDGQIGDEK
nr:efflux pump fus6 [Quercus suber]